MKQLMIAPLMLYGHPLMDGPMNCMLVICLDEPVDVILVRCMDESIMSHLSVAHLFLC